MNITTVDSSRFEFLLQFCSLQHLCNLDNCKMNTVKCSSWGLQESRNKMSGGSSVEQNDAALGVRRRARVNGNHASETGNNASQTRRTLPILTSVFRRKRRSGIDALINLFLREDSQPSASGVVFNSRSDSVNGSGCADVRPITVNYLSVCSSHLCHRCFDAPSNLASILA